MLFTKHLPATLNVPEKNSLLDRIHIMARLLTADEIMPLIASLPDSERLRLLRWIASTRGTGTSAYIVAPPTDEEFSGDDESLAWEAGGWEEFH
jgi:hypothetical protein